MPIDSVPIYTPGEMRYGFAIGKKASQDWQAAGIAIPHNNNQPYWALHFDTFTKEGFWRESLSIGYIPNRGAFDIFPLDDQIPVSATYTTLSEDGDVIEDRYAVNEIMEGNHITIRTLDTLAHKISGVFTVSMEIVDPAAKQNPANPDKVTFSNVVFEVDILD
ncbi:MAG: hypothetical protein AAFP19_26140 [Bacteroidota bacterium]